MAKHASLRDIVGGRAAAESASFRELHCGPLTVRQHAGDTPIDQPAESQ
jgi:hypothetical protein